MSPFEEKVTALLAELADARPVEVGTPPVLAPQPSGRGGRPDYVPIETAAPGARRRPVLVAAAVVLALAVVGGLLVLGRGGGSPVVASRSDLVVDTSLLGDGRMAVVVENQLYVADGPTGQVWKLTDTGRGEEVSHVSFSHDGEWVAFTIHDESGLWVSRWDGSERHRIGRSPRSYSWSPTEDRLAYTTQNELRVSAPGQDTLVVSTGDQPAPTAFTSVVWSPDGESLGYQGADGHPHFVTLVGGETVATGVNDDADWLLAWPRESMTLVDVGVDGVERRNLAADVREGTQVVTRLADLASPQFPETWSANEARVVAVSSTPGNVTSCDLETLVCAPVGVLFAPQGYRDPALSPDGALVALVGGFGGSEMQGTTLVVADLANGGSSSLGAVDSGPRGTIRLGSSWFGVGSEAPVWIDGESLLIRVDSSAVIRIDVATGTRTTVVEGDRFLPPADDYPGGTGLAYWSPS